MRLKRQALERRRGRERERALREKEDLGIVYRDKERTYNPESESEREESIEMHLQGEVCSERVR